MEEVQVLELFVGFTGLTDLVLNQDCTLVPTSGNVGLCPLLPINSRFLFFVCKDEGCWLKECFVCCRCYQSTRQNLLECGIVN